MVWLLSLTITAALVSFALVWRRFWNSSNHRNEMPPGPKGLPVVGNLLELVTAVPIQRKLHLLAREYGPIMFLRTGSIPVIVISSCRQARDFFKNHDAVFADRPNIQFARIIYYGRKDVALAPYGDHWRQAKKFLISQLLAPKVMGSFAQVRETEADLMIRNVHNMEQDILVDVRKVVSTFTSNIIWVVMVGYRYGEEQRLVTKNMKFEALIAEISRTSASLGNIGDYIPWLSCLERFLPMTYRMKRLRQIYDTFMDGVLQGREENHNDNKRRDFVGALMDNHSLFGRDHIKAFALDMFIAGTQISTTAEWVMSLLLKNPQTLRKAQEELNRVLGTQNKVREVHLNELKYLRCVLKETLRLYPTVPLLGPRMSMEESEVVGYKMPRGTVVFVNSWALGRDESVWRDAEEFIPERFMGEKDSDITGLRDEDVKMMPFSMGRRGCPGASLAIPCVLLGVATLIQCFDWYAYGDIDMAEKFGPGISRKSPLLASPTSRAFQRE